MLDITYFYGLFLGHLKRNSGFFLHNVETLTSFFQTFWSSVGNIFEFMIILVMNVFYTVFII